MPFCPSSPGWFGCLFFTKWKDGGAELWIFLQRPEQGSLQSLGSGPRALRGCAWTQKSCHIPGRATQGETGPPQYLELYFTAQQNILGWKEPTWIIQPNSYVNSPYRDRTHNLGTISTMLWPTQPILQYILQKMVCVSFEASTVICISLKFPGWG